MKKEKNYIKSAWIEVMDGGVVICRWRFEVEDIKDGYSVNPKLEIKTPEVEL